MTQTRPSRIAQVLREREPQILERWLDQQVAQTRSQRITRGQLEDQARQFLSSLSHALQNGATEDLSAPVWAPVCNQLTALSVERAQQGFTPSETALFVFSLKQPLFDAVRQAGGASAPNLDDELWVGTLLLDRLGLVAVEAYQHTREDVIRRQQQELLELSTPVVRLWDGVLALPLIGTLDSARTQVVMESLLQSIVDTGSSIAIVDITGVPTVDTLVAQHLLKTVAAARLMGAECIISGIRPQTAQTIVHLGVDLSSVITKATLADAFRLAMGRLGLAVSRSAAGPANGPGSAERRPAPQR
jgi:rsbT co-antagonist protein RsbR